VTITYTNGAVLEAIVLSHENNEIRAIAAGCDEALVLTRIHGTWVSEDLEPVAVRFAWEATPAPHAESEDAYVCSKELAARLIQKLFSSSDDEEMAGKLYVRHKGSRPSYEPSELSIG
jgi:hypothetical protein